MMRHTLLRSLAAAALALAIRGTLFADMAVAQGPAEGPAQGEGMACTSDDITLEWGQCMGNEFETFTTCEPGTVCVMQNDHYAQCILEEFAAADAIIECSAGSGCMCSEEDEPVCSSDTGTTYINMCEAECAGDSANVADGECAEDDGAPAPAPANDDGAPAPAPASTHGGYGGDGRYGGNGGYGRNGGDGSGRSGQPNTGRKLQNVDDNAAPARAPGGYGGYGGYGAYGGYGGYGAYGRYGGYGGYGHGRSGGAMPGRKLQKA